MATKKRGGARYASRQKQHRKSLPYTKKRNALHAKPRRHVKTRTSTKKTQDRSTVPISESYEEVIIRNIVNNTSGRSVPDEAVLLSSALSNLSPGIKEAHYKYGMQVGRALYKLNSSSKEYMFPEESLADLVTFFENAGHKHITYNAIPDHLELNIHGKGPTIGANLHDFEAGIISGYVGAAEKRHVQISEVECVNNNGARCKFVPAPGAAPGKMNPERTIESLAEHLSRTAPSKGADKLVDSYYSLASESILDASYTEALGGIADYLGKDIADRISNGKEKVSAAKAARVIKMLNLGEPELISSKPFKMRVRFGSLSRKSFVELSMAFISGLFSRIGGNTVATERSSNGSYVIDIMEKAQKA